MSSVAAKPIAQTQAKILVVEDDPKTAELVALYLRHAGHRVHVEHTGDHAQQRIDREPFDAYVFDVMLPGTDGLALCESVRAQGDAPVLLLTAQSLEDQRVAGLELGADDYLTKPFSLREMVARVQALLRRAPPTRSPWLRHRELRLDAEGHRATLASHALDLTPSEFAILAALVERPGRAWTRERLLRRLPATGREPLDRVVDVHVRNLRRKLSVSPGGASYVETVHGVGYRCPE